MSSYVSNDGYAAWGWFLWVGVLLLIFASVGNWRYTYRAHRKYEDRFPRKSAIEILNERYVRGEIRQEQFQRMKAEIAMMERIDSKSYESKKTA